MLYLCYGGFGGLCCCDCTVPLLFGFDVYCGLFFCFAVFWVALV